LLSAITANQGHRHGRNAAKPVCVIRKFISHLIDQRIVEKDKQVLPQVTNKFMTVLRSSPSDCIRLVESARSVLKKRIPKLQSEIGVSKIEFLSPASNHRSSFPDFLRLKQSGAVVPPYSFLPSSVG
jgi:hypothetical protein